MIDEYAMNRRFLRTLIDFSAGTRSQACRADLKLV